MWRHKVTEIPTDQLASILILIKSNLFQRPSQNSHWGGRGRALTPATPNPSVPPTRDPNKSLSDEVGTGVDGVAWGDASFSCGVPARMTTGRFRGYAGPSAAPSQLHHQRLHRAARTSAGEVDRWIPPGGAHLTLPHSYCGNTRNPSSHEGSSRAPITSSLQSYLTLHTVAWFSPVGPGSDGLSPVGLGVGLAGSSPARSGSNLFSTLQ